MEKYEYHVIDCRFVSNTVQSLLDEMAVTGWKFHSHIPVYDCLVFERLINNSD